MSQFERYQPLAFTAARAAFQERQIAKEIRLLEEAESVALKSADPHVVTRGSGFGQDGGQPSTKNRLSPYKPGVAEQSKWDWYQSTVEVEDPGSSGLVNCLLKAWEFSDFVPAKNLNGYHYGGQIVRGERVLCHLCWGGQPGVNVKTTSDESHVLAEALASFGVGHLPTRVDACLDWEEDELFNTLAAALIEFAQLGKGLAINMQGDWTRGIGRTLYLGSTSSPVRLVLYEKGYEQGGDAPLNWVRLEARVRPKKEHRAEVSKWSPEHAFSAGWIAAACKHIRLDDLEKRAVGTIWKRTDDEKTRWAMLRQYGSALRKWAAEYSSYEEFGRALGEALEQDEKGRSTWNASENLQDAEVESEIKNATTSDARNDSGTAPAAGSDGQAVPRRRADRKASGSGGGRGAQGPEGGIGRSGKPKIPADGEGGSERHTGQRVAGTSGDEAIRGSDKRREGKRDESDGRSAENGAGSVAENAHKSARRGGSGEASAAARKRQAADKG